MNAPVTASRSDLWSVAVRWDRACLPPWLNNCVCFLGGSTRQVNGTPHKGFVRPEQLLEGKVSVCVCVGLFVSVCKSHLNDVPLSLVRTPRPSTSGCVSSSSSITHPTSSAQAMMCPPSAEWLLRCVFNCGYYIYIYIIKSKKKMWDYGMFHYSLEVRFSELTASYIIWNPHKAGCSAQNLRGASTTLSLEFSDVLTFSESCALWPKLSG